MGYECVHKDEKRRREELGASWEVPRQSRPKVALIGDDSAKPEPTLSISFIKKEGFKATLKHGKIGKQSSLYVCLKILFS